MEHDTGETQPFLDSKAAQNQAELNLIRQSLKKGETMKTLDAQEKNKEETKVKKKKIDKDLSHQQVKEYVDVLEIFNVNKDIFIKILKEPDVGIAKQFHIKQAPKKLTKSVSFPVFGSSRPLRPTTLEHKQKEHWYVPKGENLLFTISLPTFDSFESQKDQYSGNGSSLEQNSSLSSYGLSGGSDNHWFNHMVMNGFKEMKKRIKKALEDKKKKKKHAPSSSIHGKVDSDNDIRREELHPMKRTSSLNDSLDRYSQLFEQSSRRKVKFQSKSLKLTNEDNKSASKGNQPKFFRRISSLSSLETFGSFLTELSRDPFSSDMEIRKSMDFSMTIGSDKAELQENKVSEKMESRDSVDFPEGLVECRSVKDTAKASGIPETIVAPEEENARSYEEHDSNFGNLQREILQQQCSVSVPASCSSDNIAGKSETFISEVSELNSRENPQDLSTRNEIHGNYQDCKVDEEDGTHFNYVKNILELSGFLGNKDLGGEKWHSEDQPLSPSLVNKLESLTDNELNGHRLLFDLVNKALMEVYKRSSIYFPRAFAFTRRISPMPKGKHLLDEVWGRMIRWSLNESETDLDRSLDDLVACDMAKGGDGWMELETEAEWLALELEDLIFDELLDELLC